MRTARTLVAAIAAALLLSPPRLAAAQQDLSATVTMSADRTNLAVGEVFRLEVRADVSGAANAHIELPDLGAFDVLGRQVSSPLQFRFGFGGQTQHVQSTTIHRLTLRAREAGTFPLAPAAVVAPGGRRFESNPLTIHVTGAPSSSATPLDPAPSAADPGTPPDIGAEATEFDPQGFIRTVVDEARPYVGQQVTVTVYLYVREPPHRGLTITKEPTADGFWVHDLLPPTRSLDGRVQIVRGMQFHVYVVRRFAAFPLRAGPLTIGPTAVSLSTSRSVFDIFGARAAPPLDRTGVPLTIEAQELPPDGRPSGDVHVGSLELAAELDRTQVATGDAVQLTVTARGTGNIAQVNIPSPSAPGLRVLEPETAHHVAAPGDIVGGTRTFRWLLIPEREGTTTLGPFEVPVFDPATRTYSVARAPALTLVAAGNPAHIADDPEEQEQVRDERESELSIGPIRTRSALTRGSSRSILDAPWLPWAFAIGPLVFTVALVARLAGRRNGDAARTQRLKRRAVKRQLSAAAAHAGANEPREFYAAIAQSLKELLEAKLERAVGSLTHAELRRALVDRGMHAELADRIVDELEGCDFARFAAAGAHREEMQACLTRTRALIDELDRFVPRTEEAV